MSEVEEKVIEVLATVLDISISDIPLDAGPGVIDKWDSLKHMMLVIALEEEFDISFSDDDLTDLLSLKLIIQIISEKLELITNG